MSYFNEVYNDPELSARAKQVLVYLHDRANKDGESWWSGRISFAKRQRDMVCRCLVE